jgi:hypothetical protein
MFARRRNALAQERLTNRRAREDEAGRLVERIPDLENLSIDIAESREGNTISETKYTLRVPLPGATALFEVTCSDRGCKEGGYDITREVLFALRDRKERFEGQVSCQGQCGRGPCTRVLHYVGSATYKTPSA